ncbi:HAD-IIA family hydrolase [Cellulomonas marina]|uniref:Haloacid Dehalogenase Superfamily Class (Subfamily) IIA/haloacid dehalogenase superfamily, subfamily IA, variant 1 with third motif having Dx(3-4)D or Dx(3-4)E n=1 Tax=Cellulomonas marina TaxID=988821 RepID=A0A1I0ZUT4_9CELL|nr:HAD-IIA family hydrolase [Cellulomonas marina]GIG28773.1 haloacid dehalogenase [Cellulomonas marina]SFB28826.1 Haloacid Dehalogenase Superfamily Class (subfamily) IIA/haloacid dehalogenase superfamily, subfamily IA, variant 1 with third motif having Dx(3-4)D or Dx(3-4)E [Cellulomonas marina]
MSGGLVASPQPPAEGYDLALVDLDGVAYRGPEPIEHAAASLTTARARGMRLVFVTNNASREPGTVAEHLSGLDIPTTPEEVMTAAQACAQLLLTRLAPGSRVLVVGGAGLLTAVREAGFTVVSSADDDPVAVAQGFALEVGWTQLAEAAYAVQRGAWHVASNRDLSIPTARGTAPGNGSLVAAVVAATGVEPASAGKPEPTMYHLAVQRAGARRVLVVGDRLDTDLAGARGGGYDGLHVLTGVSSARDAVLAPPHLRPHLLGADLRALLVRHPVPVPGAEGWWTCRAAAARVVDGRLELRGPTRVSADDDLEPAVDVARAACAAVWAAVDEGRAVDPVSVPDLVVTS